MQFMVESLHTGRLFLAVAAFSSDFANFMILEMTQFQFIFSFLFWKLTDWRYWRMTIADKVSWDWRHLLMYRVINDRSKSTYRKSKPPFTWYWWNFKLWAWSEPCNTLECFREPIFQWNFITSWHNDASRSRGVNHCRRYRTEREAFQMLHGMIKYAVWLLKVENHCSHLLYPSPSPDLHSDLT